MSVIQLIFSKGDFVQTTYFKNLVTEYNKAMAGVSLMRPAVFIDFDSGDIGVCRNPLRIRPGEALCVIAPTKGPITEAQEAALRSNTELKALAAEVCGVFQAAGGGLRDWSSQVSMASCAKKFERVLPRAFLAMRASTDHELTRV